MCLTALIEVFQCNPFQLAAEPFSYKDVIIQTNLIFIKLSEHEAFLYF